jgi:hypothetical protein
VRKRQKDSSRLDFGGALIKCARHRIVGLAGAVWGCAMWAVEGASLDLTRDHWGRDGATVAVDSKGGRLDGDWRCHHQHLPGVRSECTGGGGGGGDPPVASAPEILTE